MRATISFSTGASRAALGHAAADHLDRAADAGERVLHFVRDDRRHLAQPGQRRLLAQLLLHLHSRAEIVEDAGELPLAVDRDLADRQMQRKRRAVLPPALHLASDADDLGSTGRQIARQIGVVLLVIRRRHQHVDVPAEHLLLPRSRTAVRPPD